MVNKKLKIFCKIHPKFGSWKKLKTKYWRFWINDEDIGYQLDKIWYYTSLFSREGKKVSLIMKLIINKEKQRIHNKLYTKTVN